MTGVLIRRRGETHTEEAGREDTQGDAGRDSHLGSDAKDGCSSHPAEARKTGSLRACRGGTAYWHLEFQAFRTVGE